MIGKFKAGGQGFGEIKAGGVTMANQVGRVDTAQEELANKMIYDGNKEELILEPSDSKLKQRAPGITTMNSKVPRIKDKHTIAAEEELNSALQEELVVDASGKAFGADARGGNPMKNKVDRVTKHEETAIKELEKDKVELILDANRDILKPKAPNVSSMKNKTERIRPRNMSLVERELSQANRHELDLRPTDVAIRQSIQGVTSMNNKARSDRTDRNEELANIDTEKEELIIEPKDLKPKILGGASMANTGDKPPKLEEEKQLRKNDRSNKIELDLDQNDDARRKRVPGGSSMSRSSSRQTISRNNSNNTTSNTIKDSKTDSRSKLKVKTDGKSLEKVKEEPTPPVLRAPGVTGKDPALKQPKNSFVNNDSSPSKMISKLDEELASLGLK